MIPRFLEAGNPLPNQIVAERSKCCGCTACYNSCPKSAIVMKTDEKGFFYPDIDKNKCIDCGLCERICPILKNEKHYDKPDAYIVRYKNASIVKQSTSGGMFTALAMYVFDHSGVVYGAGYDDSMNVICKRAIKKEQLQEMRGSKFVQSDPSNAFKEVKRDLEKGRMVLYTGTPCQISGLLAYLKTRPQNLICMDFVCRGVPSPGLWKNYVQFMENKFGSKMVKARFKNKTYGYHSTTMKIVFQNGKTYYGSGRIDPFMKAFVTEMSSRDSCYSCAFKGVEHMSDITAFDCYEYTEITGNLDDDKGYSSVFIHSANGKRIFESLKPELLWQSVNLDQIVTKNGIMVNHSARPNPKRDEFYHYAEIMPIDKAMKITNPITLSDFLIEKSKKILYKTGFIGIVRKLKKNTVETND